MLLEFTASFISDKCFLITDADQCEGSGSAFFIYVGLLWNDSLLNEEVDDVRVENKDNAQKVYKQKCCKQYNNL